MEETLRRPTRGPHPADVAGLLTDEEVQEANKRVETLRTADADRLENAMESFDLE